MEACEGQANRINVGKKKKLQRGEGKRLEQQKGGADQRNDKQTFIQGRGE